MHTSKDELEAMVLDGYEGRHVDSGGIRIAFETMPANFPPDESPFKGLPNDRCQCDHWGYCFKGSFRVTYKDAPEEIVSEGEAYHLRATSCRRSSRSSCSSSAPWPSTTARWRPLPATWAW
jgi:hypothetical protein